MDRQKHLEPAPGCLIAGEFHAGTGPVFERIDPATGEIIWQGNAAGTEQIAAAVQSAHQASEGWAALSTEQREKYLGAFAQAVAARRTELQDTICRETGRPRWEVKGECDALIGKIALTKKAFHERRGFVQSEKDGLTAATRYKPLGVIAVLGPFNLPVHLPNGHIVPALLAGNTVIFKPSEFTPGTGEIYARLWMETGLPAGVFNMLHGGREVGAALAGHADINAVLFTGSRKAGIALSEMLAHTPGKLLALELGGNNPLIATSIGNSDAAALAIIQSAFLTAGQRCTCARRLILLDGPEGDRLLQRTATLAKNLRVGPPAMEPEPFMGPVISDAAAEKILASQKDLLAQGAKAILPLRPLDPRPAMLSPGILDITANPDPADEEIIGPLLQVIRVTDFNAALAAANRTRFGLVAALLSDDRNLYDRFFQKIRAGIINWNRPTNGASSALPFGGLGHSGNHRPAGAFSVDYTNDPVASLESAVLEMPAALPPGITL